MALASRLQVRTLVRPDGRLTTVVVRRRRDPVAVLPPPAAAPRPTEIRSRGKPTRGGPVPAACRNVGEFSRPVSRALATLGARACPIGAGGIALDGRRAPLSRVVAEANRRLLAAGRLPIAYPGVWPREGR